MCGKFELYKMKKINNSKILYKGGVLCEVYAFSVRHFYNPEIMDEIKKLFCTIFSVWDMYLQGPGACLEIAF